MLSGRPPAAWGTVDFTPAGMKLSVLYGKLVLKQLTLPQRATLEHARAELSGRVIDKQLVHPLDRTIRFDSLITVSAKSPLEVRLG